MSDLAFEHGSADSASWVPGPELSPVAKEALAAEATGQLTVSEIAWRQQLHAERTPSVVAREQLETESVGQFGSLALQHRFAAHHGHAQH